VIKPKTWERLKGKVARKSEKRGNKDFGFLAKSRAVLLGKALALITFAFSLLPFSLSLRHV
jgi:hypothetical protein